MRRMRWKRVGRWVPAGLVAMLALGGCDFLHGPQSVLEPAGPVAQAQLNGDLRAVLTRGAEVTAGRPATDVHRLVQCVAWTYPLPVSPTETPP